MAGNYQRAAFEKHVKGMPQPSHEGAPGMSGGSSESGRTTIRHMSDGSHQVDHHDGEKSQHPNAGHMAMHMAAKHDGGEHGHIHAKPEGGADTHHVGMDGQVTGPEEHGSVPEAANHIEGMMGDGDMPNEMPSGGNEDNEL